METIQLYKSSDGLFTGTQEEVENYEAEKLNKEKIEVEKVAKQDEIKTKLTELNDLIKSYQEDYSVIPCTPTHLFNISGDLNTLYCALLGLN